MAERDVSVKLWLEGGRTFAADARRAARAINEIGDEMRRTNREARGAGDGLGIVQRMIGLIKPATLIAGLGLAAGGLSAVAAGGVGVVSALGPMVGVLAPAAAGMVALKTSMGLVKVAQMGLAASMKGVFADFQKATPATNAFARTVKGMVPQLLTLKNAVQGRILGGFSDGLKSAAPLIGKLSPAIKQTASVIGDLGREAGTTAAGLGGPLSRILTTNAGLIKNVGKAGLNIAVIFVRLLDAARPLTAWLGRLALGWSKSALASTNAAAKSGRLTKFFEKTRAVLTRVFSIVGNLAVGLFGVGKAASGMGGNLLKSIDDATARFAKFTTSVGGQRQLRKFFADAEPVIRQVFGLIGDIAGAFARLSVGAGGGLAPLIGKLREVVPVLARVVSSTTAAFGPAIVDLIVAVAKAFEPLAGSSGPLVLFVRGLTKLAQAAAWVAQTVPGGSAALSVLFGLFAVSQAVGIASFASSLFGAGRGIDTIKRAAVGAQGAYAALTGWQVRYTAALVWGKAALIASTIATKAMKTAQWALNAAMSANPLTRIVMVLFAIGAAVVWAYKKFPAFRQAVNSAFSWLKEHVPPILSAVKNAVVSVVNRIGGAWGTLKRGVRTVVSFVRDKFSGMVGFIKSIPGRIARIASGMWNGIKTGASRAVSWVADRFRDLVRFVKRIPGAIADAIKSVPGMIADTVGSVPGGIAKAAGGLVGIGGRAKGGPVAAGTPYLVGERGPELFTPRTAGSVTDAATTATILRQVTMPAPISSSPINPPSLSVAATTVPPVTMPAPVFPRALSVAPTLSGAAGVAASPAMMAAPSILAPMLPPPLTQPALPTMPTPLTLLVPPALPTLPALPTSPSPTLSPPALPTPAPIRSPRVRQRSGQTAAERIDVHVQVGPTTLRIGDRDVGEATGRAVTTHTARKR